MSADNCLGRPGPTLSWTVDEDDDEGLLESQIVLIWEWFKNIKNNDTESYIEAKTCFENSNKI